MRKGSSEVPVKQGSGIRKSEKVFGHGQKNAKMVRASLYDRVSPEDQQTLPMQDRTMREYAARRGWTIAVRVNPGRTTAEPGSNGGKCNHTRLCRD
jgi:hypothetical protein